MSYLEAYRKRMLDEAQKFRTEIDAMMQCCDCIFDRDKCDDCPLYHNCLRDESVESIWSDVSAERIARFYEYADDTYNSEELTDEDILADMAERQREDDFVYGEE